MFPNEPLVRVRGTLMEAQFVESMLLNFMNFQSLIATKTARVVTPPAERPVHGVRPAAGPRAIDGALSASRAAYIGGRLVHLEYPGGRKCTASR